LVVVRSSGGIAGELWLVPPAGGSPRPARSDPPGVFSNDPVFTLDGRGLIHQSNRAGATNLWILPLNGDPPVRLTTGAGPDESPSVARTGTIAFTVSHWRAALVLHHLGTGQTRQLLTDSAIMWAPSFSPDTREVAFSRGETDGSWHIWMAPIEGGMPRRLTSGRLPEIYPRFSPDGAAVIYHTWSSGVDRVWRVPRSGGPAVALTPPRDDDDGYADVSPDGQWIAFARTEKGTTRICIARMDGGQTRLLTDGESTVPRWSPDGRWIAFSRSRSLRGGVFVVGADGANLRRLSETGSWPVWWHDGKHIGYLDRAADGTEQIFIAAREGGPSRLLHGLRFIAWNHPFDVSADGALLVSSDTVHLSSEIWLLEAQR
jgi:TolB protein